MFRESVMFSKSESAILIKLGFSDQAHQIAVLDDQQRIEQGWPALTNTQCDCYICFAVDLPSAMALVEAQLPDIIALAHIELEQPNTFTTQSDIAMWLEDQWGGVNVTFVLATSGGFATARRLISLYEHLSPAHQQLVADFIFEEHEVLSLEL